MVKDEIIIKLKEVVVHNTKRLSLVGGDFNQASCIISFLHEDISIYDPFYDSTGRFEVDPVDYYGMINLQKMIKRFDDKTKNP